MKGNETACRILSEIGRCDFIIGSLFNGLEFFVRVTTSYVIRGDLLAHQQTLPHERSCYFKRKTSFGHNTSDFAYLRNGEIA